MSSVCPRYGATATVGADSTRREDWLERTPMTELSDASRRIVDRLPKSTQGPVRRRLQRLECELARHRAVSVSLVTTYKRGKLSQSIEWEDLDLTNELAE